MTDEQDLMLSQIHATIVRGMPSSASLRAAAQEVVAARYASNWDRLKDAINTLATVLEENEK